MDKGSVLCRDISAQERRWSEAFGNLILTLVVGSGSGCNRQKLLDLTERLEERRRRKFPNELRGDPECAQLLDRILEDLSRAGLITHELNDSISATRLGQVKWNRRLFPASYGGYISLIPMLIAALIAAYYFPWYAAVTTMVLGSLLVIPMITSSEWISRGKLRSRLFLQVNMFCGVVTCISIVRFVVSGF